MKVFIYPDAAAVGREAAHRLAERLQKKPDSVLGLPTGDTPLGMYSELCRLHREEGLTLSRASSFNLDEYAGLPEAHPASYHTYMRENLLAHVDLPASHCHVPDGNSEDLDQACLEYEAAIQRRGGLDIVVLGIGHDGHIAFNEPPSSLASRTRAVRLAHQTRRANRSHFAEAETIPQMALTMGVGTILEARALLLLATGQSKAEILERAIEGPLSAMVPATAIQLHPEATVLCDEAAASQLRLRDYYRQAYPVCRSMGRSSTRPGC